MRKGAVLLAACAVLTRSAGIALDWPIRVGDSYSTPSPITATLGEYRDTPPGPHFHSGVDIAAAAGTPVYAILAGTARVEGARVSVTSGSVVLSYVHITPVANIEGKSLVAHELLGHVALNHDHLHLTEVSGDAYQNPLRSSGGLTGYRDDSWPQVWDVQLYDLAELGLVTPLGDMIPSGVEEIVIIARALDRQDGPGSQNTGVCSIGYKIMRSDGQVVDDGFSTPRQVYASIPTSIYEWPYHAYAIPDSKGAGTGPLESYYFPNNAIDADMPVDVTGLEPGKYRLWVLVKDIKGNGAGLLTQRGAACTTFYLCTSCTTVEKAQYSLDGTKVVVTGHTYGASGYQQAEGKDDGDPDYTNKGYIALKDADGSLGDPVEVTVAKDPSFQVYVPGGGNEEVDVPCAA